MDVADDHNRLLHFYEIVFTFLRKLSRYAYLELLLLRAQRAKHIPLKLYPSHINVA